MAIAAYSSVIKDALIPQKTSRRLRILHIGKFYPPHKGGMETHLQTLCGQLRRFADVKVIVANNGQQSVEDLVDGVEVTRVGNLIDLAAAPICPGMVRQIRETKADIVHIHFPNPTAILAYLASGHKGRFVMTWHSDIIRQKILGKAFQPILKRVLKRCAAIIATSPNYVESSPLLSAYRERCHVIPLGIPFEEFQQVDHAVVAKIRKQYGPRIVFSLGRLIYYKGFEYLIQAMKKVDARLLIVGDGPLRADLERVAQAHGVENRVTFFGEVQNVVPYYHAADVFALASTVRSEAFGIVQLEAMACGKPVVNTHLASGVPFVSIDGVTGLTVPPANPEALANAINLLLDDSALRARYGEAGQQRVREEFSLDAMTQRTFQLYKAITNGHQSASTNGKIHVLTAYSK